MQEYSRGTGIPILGIKSLKRGGNPLIDFLAYLRLFHIIKTEVPHIVHTNTSKAGILGRWAARACRVPGIVHTPHGHIFYGYFGPVTTWFFILAERITARFTDRIITLTGQEKEDHLRFRIGKAVQLVPIHCGIDLEKFVRPTRTPRELRHQFGFSPQNKVVGWVGRLVPVKGCGYFIEAARILGQKNPEVKFLIVGAGPLKPELEKQGTPLMKDKRLVFVGQRNDIPDIMHSLDLFVLSSLNEGMGRVLIEAMAAGVPVIATRVGGVMDVVQDGETGFLVPPQNPGAIAEAIARLLHDVDFYRQLQKRGKQWAQGFSIEKTVDETIKVYQQVLLKKTLISG